MTEGHNTLTPQQRRYKSENAQYQASLIGAVPMAVALVATESVIVAFAVWFVSTMVFTAILGWKRGLILNE